MALPAMPQRSRRWAPSSTPFSVATSLDSYDTPAATRRRIMDGSAQPVRFSSMSVERSLTSERVRYNITIPYLLQKNDKISIIDRCRSFPQVHSGNVEIYHVENNSYIVIDGRVTSSIIELLRIAINEYVRSKEQQMRKEQFLAAKAENEAAKKEKRNPDYNIVKWIPWKFPRNTRAQGLLYEHKREKLVRSVKVYKVQERDGEYCGVVRNEETKKKSPKKDQGNILRIASTSSIYLDVNPELLKKESPMIFFLSYRLCAADIPESTIYGIKLEEKSPGADVACILAYEHEGIWRRADPIFIENESDEDLEMEEPEEDDDVIVEFDDLLMPSEEIMETIRASATPSASVISMNDDIAEVDSNLIEIERIKQDPSGEEMDTEETSEINGDTNEPITKPPVTFIWRTIKNDQQLLSVSMPNWPDLKELEASRRAQSLQRSDAQAQSSSNSCIESTPIPSQNGNEKPQRTKKELPIPQLETIYKCPALGQGVRWNRKFLQQYIIERIKHVQQPVISSTPYTPMEFKMVIKFGKLELRSVHKDILDMKPMTFADLPGLPLQARFNSKLPMKLFEPLKKMFLPSVEKSKNVLPSNIYFDLRMMYKTHSHELARVATATVNASNLEMESFIRDERGAIGYPRGIADISMKSVGGETNASIFVSAETKLRTDVKPIKKFGKVMTNYSGSGGPGLVFEHIPDLCEVIAGTMKRTIAFQYKKFSVWVSRVTEMTIEPIEEGGPNRRKIVPLKSKSAEESSEVKNKMSRFKLDTESALLDDSNSWLNIEVRVNPNAFSNYIKGRKKVKEEEDEDNTDLMARMQVAAIWVSGMIDHAIKITQD